MDSFPPEILLRIFWKLEYTTICRLSQCNKTIHRICSDNQLWMMFLQKKLSINGGVYIPRTVPNAKEEFMNLVVSCRNTKKRMLSDVHDQNDLCVVNMVTELKRLRSELHNKSKPFYWQKLEDDNERQRASLHSVYKKAKQYVNLYTKMVKTEDMNSDINILDVAENHLKKASHYGASIKSLSAKSYTSPRVANMMDGLRIKAEQHLEDFKSILDVMEESEVLYLKSKYPTLNIYATSCCELRI
jgi:hypothetical protein